MVWLLICLVVKWNVCLGGRKLLVVSVCMGSVVIVMSNIINWMICWMDVNGKRVILMVFEY